MLSKCNKHYCRSCNPVMGSINSLPWLSAVEQTTQPPSQSFAVSTHTARNALKGFIGGPHGLGKTSDSHPIICATSCFLGFQQNRAVGGTRPWEPLKKSTVPRPGLLRTLAAQGNWETVGVRFRLCQRLPRAGLADVVDYRLMFFIPIPQ